MTTCLLGLGSNLGDRKARIAAAVQHLAQHPQIQVERVSRLAETQPIGGPAGQTAFLNAAAVLTTQLSPSSLLDFTQQCERSLGRARSIAWDSRPIDIDILLYGDQVVDQPKLQVPHPWMVVRRFVLAPSVEIAAAMRHPQLGWTVRQLHDHLLNCGPRFAILGVGDVDRQGQIAAGCQGQWIQVRPPQQGSTIVRDLAEQLECTRDVAAKVRASGWCDERPSNVCLSDVWLEELRLTAERTLPSDALAAYQQEFDRLVEPVPDPKLVLIVGCDTAAPSVDEDTISQRVIRDQACPFLRVASSPQVVDRVVSAITSMS